MGQTGIFPIENASGVDRDRFEVLAIDGTVFSPDENLTEFQNRIAFRGVTPTDTTSPVAILLEPVADGRIGRAVVSGVAVVQVDLIDTEHTHAVAIEDDSTKLESAEGGSIEILVIDRSATGTKWAIVRIGAGGAAEDEYYELTENLDAGGTADAHPLVWDSSSGDYTVDTETTVTLHDLLGEHWGLAGERVKGRTRSTATGPIVVVLSSGAPWHIFSLSADMAAGETKDATVTIRGASVTVSLTDAVLPAGHTFTSGTSVFAFYDRDAAKWKVTGKALIGVTPLTGYQFSTPHFQTKNRELAVLSAKTESGWTTAHDGTACPVNNGCPAQKRRSAHRLRQGGHRSRLLHLPAVREMLVRFPPGANPARSPDRDLFTRQGELFQQIARRVQRLRIARHMVRAHLQAMRRRKHH